MTSLLQYGIAISTLVAAIVYLWSAIAYKYEDYYKHISPLHVTTILFYFNIFLINIKLDNYFKISKLVNGFFIALTMGLVVVGDLYYYVIEEAHEPDKFILLYLLYAIIDGGYGIILIVLNCLHYESRLNIDQHRLGRLLCLQFAYVITTLSQIIPLYMEKQIALTNDFVYLFWLLYIMDEKTSFRYISSEVDPRMGNSISSEEISSSSQRMTEIDTNTIQTTIKKPLACIVFEKIFATIFIISTVISVYVFTITTTVHNDNDSMLIFMRDIASFVSNFCFYMWTLTSFYRVPTNVVSSSYQPIS
ncbi:MAG: hypothetical protein Terrestrivirus4_190 [Terrestrivirus sp.]|uniref:Uncharacterized protein n=1 Tax=Terrestrivirus sp. TaxID=2487775 RepID=A0A3G4ZMQ7_9VIRU|nr:MAG: hypothetical protein Terrestrivirus4_190 [Terrestrivirus sp.]